MEARYDLSHRTMMRISSFFEAAMVGGRAQADPVLMSPTRLPFFLRARTRPEPFSAFAHANWRAVSLLLLEALCACASPEASQARAPVELPATVRVVAPAHGGKKGGDRTEGHSRTEVQVERGDLRCLGPTPSSHGDGLPTFSHAQ